MGADMDWTGYKLIDEPGSVDVTDWSGYKEIKPPAPRGVGGFIKDTGLDLAKGVVSLGESAVGIADLATGGYAGKGLAALGYDPKQTNAFLSGLQSDARQQSDREVAQADGFWDTLKSLGTHPDALFGNIVQSLPGSIGAGAAGGMLVKKIAGVAATEAGVLGLTGKAAEEFIASKVTAQTFKIASVAGAAEGAQTAGSIAEQGRQGGRDWDEYVVPALAAGLGTAAIGMVSGKIASKLGIGDLETDIAARSAGVKGAGIGGGNIATRTGKEMLKEGILEEMPQSYQEQAFQNLAMGKPWEEGTGSAAAQGLLAGAGMAGGHAVLSGRNEQKPQDTTKPDPAILGAKTVDEAITAFTTPTNFTATPRGLIGSVTNATAGPGFDARSVAGDYIDGKDLADLVQTEQRDLQVMRANIERDRAKQAELDQIPQIAAEQNQTQDVVKQAATLEGPSALALALQEARQRQAPTAPEPAASTEAVSVSEPRIVERTADMTPMPKELAELQVDMDGGEVVRIQNRNGKFAYTVIKDSNGRSNAVSPTPAATLQPASDNPAASVEPGHEPAVRGVSADEVRPAADVLVPTSVLPEQSPTDALTKPVEESVQEKSHREWGENYNQVINAPDLTKVDTKSLDRAIGYGENYLGQLKRQGWDGSPVNQTLIDQIQIDVDAINAEAKARRKAVEQGTPASSTQPIGVTSSEPLTTTPVAESQALPPEGSDASVAPGWGGVEPTFDYTQNKSGNVTVKGDPTEIRTAFTGLKGATVFADGKPAGIIFGVTDSPAVLERLKTNLQLTENQNGPQAEKAVTENAGREKETAALTLPFGTQPVLTENAGDSTSSSSELLRNAANTMSTEKKGFDSLDANTVVLMKSLMGSVGQDQKVLKSVIELIPVDVVNMLARKQLTPEMLFHDPSMLQNRSVGGDRDNPITIPIDAATSIVRVMARAAAKNPSLFEFGHSGGLPVDNSPANNTGVAGSGALPVRGIDLGGARLATENSASVGNSRLGSVDGTTASDTGIHSSTGRPTSQLSEAVFDRATAAAKDVGGSENLGRIASDGSSALSTIDGKHVVTPSSNDVPGAGSASTQPAPPTVSKNSDGVQQGEQVSQLNGKYGKGMNREPAKMEAMRLNNKNTDKSITYTAEEHGDAKLENPYAVIGRKANVPSVQVAPSTGEASQQPAEPRVNGNLTTTPEQQRAAYMAEKKRREAAGNRARSQSHERNPFKAWIAKHGITSAVVSEFAPGLRERRSAMVPGYGPIFKTSGKQLDALAQLAVEDGYLTIPDVAKLSSMIHDVLSGKRHFAQYAEGIAEDEMNIRITRQNQFDAEQELSKVSDEALYALDENTIVPWTDEIDSSIEDYLLRLNATEQEIQDAVAQESEGQAASDQGGTGAQETDAGSAQGSDTQGNAEARTPAQDLLGDVPNASQQAAANILAAREKKQKDALANASAFEGLDMVDSRNGNVVAPGQQEIGQEQKSNLSKAIEIQSRDPSLGHLTEAEHAVLDSETKAQQEGALNDLSNGKTFEDAGLSFAHDGRFTKITRNGLIVASIDGARERAKVIKALQNNISSKPADPIASKPASEMSASELLRAAADKMDAEKVAPKEEAKQDNILTTSMGGSEQTLTFGKPVWEVTDAELVQAVNDSGTYLGKPGSKYDPYMTWRNAQGAAIEKAVKDGVKFSDELLYDKPGLIRNDLSDYDRDIAVDAMVDVYRDTKDYSKSVQAYRDFGKPAQPAGKIEGGIQYSRTTNGTPTLIIQHNLTEENLLHADRMGGIPVPSLAITQAAHPLENFGEITLVGGIDMADPKGYAATKVFGADIYSPRYPKATYSFTPVMRTRVNTLLKDGLKATNSNIEFGNVETNGAREFTYSPAMRWQFLTDKGITPTITRVEVKPLPDALLPFANDTRHSFELAQDPAFIDAAYKAYEADLVKIYDGDTEAARDEIAQYKARAEERDVSHLVRATAGQVNQHRMDTASAGSIDRPATNRAMEDQIRTAGLDDEMRKYSADFLKKINPDERLFQGFTNMGNRRYTPHTLDNVIKILKKDMRGGEGFNYGLGTVRSRFTPQFKSIAEIQKAKGRLMDEKAFDAVKEDVNEELSTITEALRSYHGAGDRMEFGETVTSTMYDAAKMGLPKALQENGFKDVPQEVKEQVAEFLGKLRNMPTAYFEAKILRAVDLSEFKGAVVPKQTSRKAIDALNRRGVTNIKYYDKNVTGDRAAKIQELAKESDLMFSRSLQGDEFWRKIKTGESFTNKELTEAKFSEGATQNSTTVPALEQAIRELTGKFLGNKLGRIVATTSSEIKSHWESLIGDNVQESQSIYRAGITKVRGGWTKEKIIKELKTLPSKSGKFIQREIAKFDSAEQLGEHIFYHGTGVYVGKGLRPSITMSERQAEQSGGGGYGERYFAVSVSKSKNIASNFTGQSRYGTVYPVILRKDANVISMPEISDASELEDHIVDLWTRGIDAVKIGDWNSESSEQELAILNPYSVFKYNESESFAVFNKKRFDALTENQVSEIYKKAVAEVPILDGIKTLGTKEEKNAALDKLQPFKFSLNLESEGNAGKAQAFFDPTTKTIFLLADRIEAGSEMAVLAHESMHKHGQAVLGEAGWNRLHSVIDDWYKAAPGTDERRVYDYAADRVQAIGGGEKLSSQEMFPYAVEAALKFGIKPSMMAKQGTVARWLESVRQNLKAVWGKITDKPETFKAQDMVDLAYAIAQRENLDIGSIADGKSGVLSKDGSFKGWPKFNSWTRSEYNDVVSLLPEEYRDDPHRQEPIPSKDWDVLTDSVVPQLDKINETVGAGTFRLDGLGNIQADARKNDALAFLEEVMAIADQNGLGIYVTGVPTNSIQKLRDIGFDTEMGLAPIVQREARYAAPFRSNGSDVKQNNWMQPPVPMASGGVNNPAYGTIMSYKPRGFSKVLFSRSVITGQTDRQYTPEQLKALSNIGQQVQVPTLKERFESLTKDLGKRMIQGTFDQFMPLKELGKVPYMLARLSKGASGAFDTLLHGGKLKLSDGVYDFDEQNKGGVLDKLLLPLQGEHHDFLRWVAANRAESLMGEGRENLFTPDDIKALKALSDGTTNFDYKLPNGTTTRDRTLIYADALKTFNGFQKNVMDMYEQSGGVDPEVRKAFEREFYLPFYRVEDGDGGIRGGSVKNGLVRQDAIKKLKGGKDKLNFDLLDNTLMNWASLLDAAAKNRAAKSALDTMASMGKAIEAKEEDARQMAKSIGNKEGVVWYMENGKKRFFVVDDPYLLTAVTSLEYAGMSGPIMKTMSMFKHALTVGVTASPFFKVRNLIRDSVQVIASGPISYNPAKNIAQGWKLTDPKSDAYFKLLAGGGTIHFSTMYEGSEARRVQALVDADVDQSTILNTDQKLKAFYRKGEKLLAAYNELGNRGEAVNRAALYDQLVKNGMSHAEASLQARDLMDFSMQGSFTAVRFFTQVVPFLNARLEGIYKLGRAAKEDPQRFATVLGATAVFSLALLAAYHDDDDWKKRTEGDRNNYWWFKFGGVAYRIPKPFEVGAVATVAERMAEYIFDKEMTGKRFREQIMQITKDQLAMNPVPQMVKPILDIYANKDSFSGIPIESMSMERLKPEYRFNDRTTMTARGISTAGNTLLNPAGINFLSPVQVDHLVRGYFAWLGTFVVSSADTILRTATNQPAQASGDMLKLATGGLVTDLRDAPSRYVSNLYNQAREIEQAMGTYRALQKEGKGKEAAEFLADNRADLQKYKRIEHVKQAEAKFNEKIRMIERSAMTADKKREQIRAINIQKDRVARSVMQP